jgi:hypothetical protein
VVLQVVVLERVRSHVIAGVVRVCPAVIFTSWWVPLTWQSFDDQYVSEPLVIVRICWLEPRSMVHVDDEVFVIDIETLGCSSEVYDDLSTMGLRVMSEAAQVLPDDVDPAPAVLVGAGVAAPDAPETGAATLGVAAGAAATGVDGVELATAVALDPAPACAANSAITMTTSRSTAITRARRRQYTRLDCEPTGCLNDDMRTG